MICEGELEDDGSEGREQLRWQLFRQQGNKILR